MATTTVTPYSTAQPFVTSKPTWLNEYDAQRLAAYALYDDLYRNHPDTSVAMLRGSDEKPVLVPTAKRIINTFARYCLRDYSVSVQAVTDPVTGMPVAEPTEEEIAAALGAYNQLFKRERFLSKLNSCKKQGLKDGDAILYVWGDPEKPAGSRISIKAIDPGTFFPIYDTYDPDIITGVDIIDQIVVGNDTVLKRLRFLKPNDARHPDFGKTGDLYIARELVYIEVQDWETKPKAYRGDVTSLPPQLPMEVLPGIKHLPTYHIKTQESPGNPFGTSLLAGLEQVLAGINQTWSDEDTALALAGLGMYATDGGAPVDEDGEETDWLLGPGRVVEVSGGKKFERVSGVASVEPSKQHRDDLRSEAEQTLGINDIATGKADPSVAESGIALQVRMGPLLDATDEYDTTALEVLDQLLYDLRDWFAAYETLQMPNVTAYSLVGDKLPKNRAARFEEVKALYLDGVISLAVYHQILVDEFGYEFPTGMINELQGELPNEGDVDTTDTTEEDATSEETEDDET